MVGPAGGSRGDIDRSMPSSRAILCRTAGGERTDAKYILKQSLFFVNVGYLWDLEPPVDKRSFASFAKICYNMFTLKMA